MLGAVNLNKTRAGFWKNLTGIRIHTIDPFADDIILPLASKIT